MLFATVLALVAAGLHAAWNLIAKVSDDRELALVGQFVVGGLLSAIALVVIGPPGTVALPWLVLSAGIHVVYVVALVLAYEHGDFSFAYPLARGGGALIAAIGGVVLLGDHLKVMAWVAIAVVAIGLGALVGTRASRHSLVAAGVTAATIGAYTVVDSHGARLATSGQSYGVSLILATGLSVGGMGAVRGRAGDLVASLRTQWWRYLIAGAASVAAYTLVLVAVRYAPVGHVTMLRESSVVLAALAGWLFLRERLGRQRLVCSAVILVGLIGLVAANG